jgi:hypothetical protein
MKVLDGTREGMIAACEMVAANPHPDHLREYRMVTGVEPDIESMLLDSVRESEVGAYETRGGDALVGGISSNGLVRREIWFLTTATAKNSPKWLLRSARRMLALAEKHYGPESVFGQVIPVAYPEGVNFARHLGFKQFASVHPFGDELAVMERCGLWARHH